MKWLIVLASLFAYGQASAAGLCLPTADGVSNKCIIGWNGATSYTAYAGALAAMIDKFTTIIVYDSFVNDSYWFGPRCIVDQGAPDFDPPEPTTGCTAYVMDNSVINVPLATAFHETLETAKKLVSELEAFQPMVKYRLSRSNVPEENDKVNACNTISVYHPGVASFWNKFSKAFQQDYDAYDDQYRKKIYKHYFQAIKRLYGFYTNRMKKLTRQVKREYNCNF